jgi:hypothetical protein
MHASTVLSKTESGSEVDIEEFPERTAEVPATRRVRSAGRPAGRQLTRRARRVPSQQGIRMMIEAHKAAAALQREGGMRRAGTMGAV